MTLVSGTQENAQGQPVRLRAREGANKVGHRQAFMTKPSAQKSGGLRFSLAVTNRHHKYIFLLAMWTMFGNLLNCYVLPSPNYMKKMICNLRAL